MWLKFTHPRRVIVTEKLEDVRKSLQEVESLVNQQGWTAAGFISYDAAPAFEPALKVKSSNGFPLLWFGLYDSHETLEGIENLGSPSKWEWKPDTTQDNYNAAIQTIKERIAQGKTYQVNYTMRLQADIETDKRMEADLYAWRLFTHLAHSQNKYAAFLDIGDWAVCSAS
ncbi:MAG TPA: chorismate-binding protein, partial [Anaerolineales bacterium]|nr:chorismate-binding protein [Anaerolineales bacterium]